MNLAIKDIRYQSVKFVTTTVGLGLLLMVVLTIGGIIRGVILDSSTIIQTTGADLWVVEKDKLGPFVEISRLPEDYYHAIKAFAGVADASPLVMAWEHVIHPMAPTPLMKFMYLNTLLGTKTMVKPGWMVMPKEDRFIVIGYLPGHIGGPPALVAGRNIEASHYEIVADVKTGFHPGERVRLGNYDYTVVGLTQNMMGYTADPVIYASLNDAQEILFESDPDLLRNQRERLRREITGSALQIPARNEAEMRGARVNGAFGGAAILAPQLQAPLSQRAVAAAENIRYVNAIAVKVEPGVSPETVAEEIMRWKHLQVDSDARQVNWLLMGSNRLIFLQLSLFRLILLAISGIVIGLIIYTFTLDKIKEIALLKLLGAQSRRIYSMILQQALLMSVLGTLLGSELEFAAEPYFPRRVVSTYGDVGQLVLAVIIIAVLASLFAIRRATKVEARSVLGA